MSQAELAEAVGVSPNYVGVIERGEKLPTLETLDSFARSLNTGLAMLVEANQDADKWADEASSVLRSIPTTHRRLALAILHTLLTDARKSKKTKRRKRGR